MYMYVYMIIHVSSCTERIKRIPFRALLLVCIQMYLYICIYMYYMLLVYTYIHCM